MIAAAINRCIWYALFGIGLALVAFGVYFGAFAWANDGLIAGVGVFGTSAGFGCALVITGLAFRFVAEAHAKVQPRRWWLQVLPLLVGYVAFGLAASMSSVLERKAKEWKKKETASMRRPLPYTALVLSRLEIKVARSMSNVGYFRAQRSKFLKDGQSLGGTFSVAAGEVVYLGHFYLECNPQPILWRYYPEGREAFNEYLIALKKDYPALRQRKSSFAYLIPKRSGAITSCHKQCGLQRVVDRRLQLASLRIRRGKTRTLGAQTVGASR